MHDGLPEKCFVEDQSGNIVQVARGVSGFFPVQHDPVGPRKSIGELNEALGVSPAVATAMKHGSMFGWDTPGADPMNYGPDGLYKSQAGVSLGDPRTPEFLYVCLECGRADEEDFRSKKGCEYCNAPVSDVVYGRFVPQEAPELMVENSTSE